MSFLSDPFGTTTTAINDLNNSVNKFGNVKEQGFSAPNAPVSDVGLPFTKTSAQVTAVQPSRRHLINWFVPDMGVVRMYVNPERITYNYRKLVKPQRTKGGYNIQYWGEELPTISLSGSTGSSGIEGINALYEVYRSEQYTFDAVGLTLSSNNAAENLSNNIYGAGVNALSNKIAGENGGIGRSLFSGLTSGLLSSPANNSISSRNLPTLANNALTVEMYYMGWVFRGFFTNIEITESTEMLFTYTIGFTVTQRRGYRTNFFPWHKSPIGGGGDLGNHFDQKFDPISGNFGEEYNQSTGTSTSSGYSFANIKTR